MKSQPEMVLQYMQEYGSITPLDAMRDLGIMRLAAVVWELKHRGYKVRSKSKSSVNRYGKVVYYSTYFLKENGDD